MNIKFLVFKVTFAIAFFLLAYLLLSLAFICYMSDGIACCAYIGFALFSLLAMVFIIVLPEDDKEMK